MKYIAITLIFAGFFLAGSSTNSVKAENTPCKTIISTCPDGTSYTAIVCDYGDYIVWDEIYCGLSPE